MDIHEISVVAVAPSPLCHIEAITYSDGHVALVGVRILDPDHYLATAFEPSAELRP